MTRLPRRAALLLALSLLTSATTAYAECAWVLWGAYWWGGYKTKEDCEGARKVQLVLAERDAKQYGSQRMPRAIVGECLPDTEITETPSICMWNLWRSDVVGMPKSLKTVFRTRQECEQARDAADRTLAKRGETSFTCNELDTSTEQERRPPVWLLRRTPPFEVVQSLIGTFKTHEQCQQRRGADVMKSEERKLTYCFPDTVDPRAPKGN